jgi:hypothetical protein
VGGGCVGWGGFELEIVRKTQRKESSCPSVYLNTYSSPVGRADVVLKWWLHVFFPLTYKVLSPRFFYLHYNYYFPCEK